jgi:hypothetical protein
VIDSDFLKASGFWDYAFLQFDGASLTVGGGSPFVNRTNPAVTLKFIDVSYINCPTEFHHAEFALASLSTVEDLKGTIDVGPDDVVVVAIAGESNGSFDRQVFVIVAESVQIALRMA